MIETHTIRLRGPWECEIGGRVKRTHMPVRREAVVDDDYNNRLRCQRRFGCPTCLDPHERVWLVIEKPAGPGAAALNGEQLGMFHITGSLTEFDITDRLKERNVLVLDFDFARVVAIAECADSKLASASAGRQSNADEMLFEDVRLEIRG